MIVKAPSASRASSIDFAEGRSRPADHHGRVYNAEQTPPYALPANQTQSGVKSRSSKSGGSDNFNELRFEDKKGSEQVVIHAEKDMQVEVEKDRSESVGHDEIVKVGNNRTEAVGNNESISVEKNRTESVGGDESVSIDGNRGLTVDKNETINVTGNRNDSIGKNER